MKDINKDLLMIFVMCYEYQLSFTNVLKLFSISKKYFWTFLETCSPMIKMGVRKAAMLKKTVDKMLLCLKDKSLTYEILTPREERILESFTWFLEDSFTDGEGCLHISQFKEAPFAKAYTSNNLIMDTSFNNLVKNIDDIKYIEMGGNKFYKTSKFLYFMEKYSGDTDMHELDSLSVKEMLRRIEEGEERIREKEKEELSKQE